MPRKAEGLTAYKVRTLGPGRYGDGMGLYLFVKPDGAKFWTFRYQRHGKAHELGLGVASGRHPVSLAQARVAAYQLVDQLRAGIDPAKHRADAKAAAKQEVMAVAKAKAATKAAPENSFEAVAKAYIVAHANGWKSAVHKQQWENTLRDYAFPVIGNLPVNKIETEQIIEVLKPIWEVRAETASRLRGRLERILDYAKTQKLRTGENPARWQGHLQFLLVNQKRRKNIQHHPALPYADLPAAMVKLAEMKTVPSACLRFIILTAARNSEARKATWGEIDLAAKLWTIPAERMKAGKKHEVPLCDAAIAILDAIKPDKVEAGALIFEGRKSGQPLSDVGLNKALATVAADVTVHGFRSTFRDWCAEQTNFPREIAEQCLAHATGNAVEQAYLRTAFLAKRAKLMAAWGAYCTSPPKARAANVVSMHEALTA